MLNKSFLLIGSCIAGLWLSGCTSDSHSNQASGDPGFQDQDVANMAVRIAEGIPSAPRLSRELNARRKVLVDQQYIEVNGDAVLERNLFAQRLLAELRLRDSNYFDYVDRRESSAANSLSKGSGKGKSSSGSSRGGRSGGALGGQADYRLECDVSRVPARANQAAQQCYAFQLVDHRSSAPLWTDTIEVDIPASNVTAK